MVDLQPIYVRPSRAQEVFGVCPATIYNWANKGEIRIYKRGRMSFVKASEVAAYIERTGDRLGG